MIATHLWQSTVFAVLAGLLTLPLRNHHARVRYWIWFAASVKFLVPFALLIALGKQFEWRQAPGLGPAVLFIDTPLRTVSATPVAAAQPAMSFLPWVLFAVWLGGFGIVALQWTRQWMMVRRTMRTASPAGLSLPIPALTSPGPFEPGVFGVFKPVLLLPAGITERLTPAQFDTIVAHELCHVRRRDNLTAAIHLVVETVFWFFPPVWFIRERLVAERELACDEDVLRNGDPEAYATGILDVCKHYLAAPACVSGVTGSNLKKRIESIVSGRVTRELSGVHKAWLAASGIAAVLAPIAIGVWTAPPARAQSRPDAKPLAFEVASIKPGDPDARRISFDILPGGKLVASNVPLKGYVAQAYGVSFQSKRLTGESAVLGERFDIEATPEKGAITPGMSAKERNQKVMAMLRTLLADRFHLKVRSEVKETPIYELQVGKGGPKLEKTKLDEKACEDEDNPDHRLCHQFNGGMGRGMHSKATSIAEMARFIENWTDRLVEDKTGITGLYDIETDGWQPVAPRIILPGETINPAEGDINDPNRPTIFTIMERLGLKLVAQKSPIEVFVIEHAERPTSN